MSLPGKKLSDVPSENRLLITVTTQSEVIDSLRQRQRISWIDHATDKIGNFINSFNIKFRARNNNDAVLVFDYELDGIDFAGDRWEIGFIYAQHPLNKNFYINYDNFEDELLRERCNEVVRLLLSLGAKQIEISTSESESTRSAWIMNVIEPVASTFGFEGVETSVSRNTLHIGVKGPGHSEPFVPIDLQWLPYEPTWQSIIEARTKFHVQEFEVNVGRLDQSLHAAGYSLNSTALDLSEAKRTVNMRLFCTFSS